MSTEHTVAGTPYRPLGGALELFISREPEVLLAGPSGTGKSRADLEKLHYEALQYPGFRALILRKTRESLTHSGLATLERSVLARTPGAARRYARADEYRYPNGSRLVCGGMDKVSKIMSSEYDAIYVQEATELSEDEWEHLTTRLRGSAAPFTQIIACANPAGPNHWLRQRAEAGRLTMIDSRFEDNPVLVDPVSGHYTPFGSTYLAKLDALTGVRYQRLRLGLWVSAEGVVYEEFDWNLHVRSARDAFAGHAFPPSSWRRLWAIDFGYTHPFCWQAWCQDPADGTLYRFAELYHTGLLVEEAGERIRAWMAKTGEPFPEAIIADHDAEGRATLRSKLGVPTVAAEKAVSSGIQAVKQRLIKRRLVFVREARIARDTRLVEAKRPTCTEEEIELYVWRDGVKDSEPVKANDDGLDATRYLVAYVDGQRRIWSLEEIAAFGRDDQEYFKRLEGGGGTPPAPEPDAMPKEPEDWHEQWKRDVATKQAEEKRQLLRRGY